MKKKNNQNYWNKYYSKVKLTKKPTKFAKFCKAIIKNYNIKNETNIITKQKQIKIK